MVARIITTFLSIALMGVIGCSGETTAPHNPDGVSTDSEGNPDGPDAIDLSVDTGMDLPADCSACEAIDPDKGYGTTAQQLACALDICEEDWIVSAEVYPIVPLQGDEYEDDVFQAECKLENMARAVTQFGDADNDIQPKKNGSYLFLANAPVTLGHWGDQDCRDCCDTRTESMPDPWANEESEGRRVMHDMIEYKIKLKAPDNAGSFSFKYIFMSVEFDDTLAFNMNRLRNGEKLSWGNDKFYAFVKRPGAGESERRIINYTDCRYPDLLWTRNCQGGEGGDVGCSDGQKICAISVMSAATECCWFECDDDNIWKTDLTGTGFECAADEGAETNRTGSSTGWLETSWPIEPGEEFELIFHINDGQDWSGGSAVLIDDFRFSTFIPIGTVPI